MKQYLVAALLSIDLLTAGCQEGIVVSESSDDEITQTPEEVISEIEATGEITDGQAEILGSLKRVSLNGLTPITDAQGESFGRTQLLSLSGLTTISDSQAKSLSNLKVLFLSNLNSISDSQAESLSRLKSLAVSNKIKEEINKYKNK